MAHSPQCVTRSRHTLSLQSVARSPHTRSPQSVAPTPVARIPAACNLCPATRNLWPAARAPRFSQSHPGVRVGEAVKVRGRWGWLRGWMLIDIIWTLQIKRYRSDDVGHIEKQNGGQNRRGTYSLVKKFQQKVS